ALRKCIGLMSARTLVLGQCRAGGQELRGCSPRPFQSYLDHLLGLHCIRAGTWQPLQQARPRFRAAPQRATEGPVAEGRYVATPLASAFLAEAGEGGAGNGGRRGACQAAPCQGRPCQCANGQGQAPGGGKICAARNSNVARCGPEKRRFHRVCSLCLARGHPRRECKGAARGADSR
ncbi:unnamed protein product, partial [Prorocentrum cordatum]